MYMEGKCWKKLLPVWKILSSGNRLLVIGWKMIYYYDITRE